jgi:hypothetical protein
MSTTAIYDELRKQITEPLQCQVLDFLEANLLAEVMDTEKSAKTAKKAA